MDDGSDSTTVTPVNPKTLTNIYNLMESLDIIGIRSNILDVRNFVYFVELAGLTVTSLRNMRK